MNEQPTHELYDYRTATLILALLGTVSHFYSGLTLSTMSFEEFDSGTVFGLTLYSYLSGWACLAGAVGVLKVSP
jgi:hypothetical protein